MRVNRVETVSSNGDMPVELIEWPSPIAPEGFRGIAGDFVEIVEPHTEADAAALLLQLLAFFGNAAGGSSYFPVGADRHATNINVVIVGDTASGRKGVSLSETRRLFELVDPEWAGSRIQSGLSTGEGLIWAVRDPIEKQEPIKVKNSVVGYQTVIADEGVEDKRLLVIETEYSSTLKVAEREGNTLTGVCRQAWDSGNLRNLTKNSPAKATGAHISVIAHIPKDELLRYLTSTEMGNGYANRNIWGCSRRSKELPDGGALAQNELEPLARHLRDALDVARRGGPASRDGGARELWHSVYSRLSSRKPGLLGAVLSRAEAQVVRLSLLYALLDCSLVVRVDHLRAALAVWGYAESSARFIFGDTIGDPVADGILTALRSSDVGLTRTEISDLFGRNKEKHRIDTALAGLQKQMLARCAREETGGRPVERWVAVKPGRSATAIEDEKNEKYEISRATGAA